MRSAGIDKQAKAPPACMPPAAISMTPLGKYPPGSSAFAKAALDFISRSQSPERREVAVVRNGRRCGLIVERTAVGLLSYDHGYAWAYKFRVNDTWVDYTALVVAPIDEDLRPHFDESKPLPFRLDSGCATGDHGDVTCDCAAQRRLALHDALTAGQGLLVHVPAHDGRGHGIGPKLATLTAQLVLGLDTVEAAELVNVGKPIDLRDFAGAIGVSRFLGISETTPLQFLSNNPEKLMALRENGLCITPVPLVVPPTDFTERHFAAKAKRLGHANLLEKVPA